MEALFEILKYTIPSLIVFVTAFMILRQYLNAQYNLKHLEQTHENASDIIPIKLQAYERLLLLCERMKIPNAIFRLNAPELQVNELRNNLLVSLQKEFEHNLVQKLYVSNKLWEIIELAKNETLNEISVTAELFEETDDCEYYINALHGKNQTAVKKPLDIALRAIKEEAKMILEIN